MDRDGVNFVLKSPLTAGSVIESAYDRNQEIKRKYRELLLGPRRRQARNFIVIFNNVPCMSGDAMKSEKARKFNSKNSSVQYSHDEGVNVYIYDPSKGDGLKFEKSRFFRRDEVLCDTAAMGLWAVEIEYEKPWPIPESTPHLLATRVADEIARESLRLSSGKGFCCISHVVENEHVKRLLHALDGVATYKGGAAIVEFHLDSRKISELMNIKLEAQFYEDWIFGAAEQSVSSVLAIERRSWDLEGLVSESSISRLDWLIASFGETYEYFYLSPLQVPIQNLLEAQGFQQRIPS